MVQNILFYKDDGSAAIVQHIDPFSTIKSWPAGSFAPGWTDVVWSQTTGLGFFYSRYNGAAAIAEEFYNGAGGAGGFPVPNDIRTLKGYQSGAFATNWTSIVETTSAIFSVPGILVFYNKDNGSAEIKQIQQNGLSGESKPPPVIEPGWTNIAPGGEFMILFLYNRTNHSAKVGFIASYEKFPSNSCGDWTHLATAWDEPVH